MGSLRFFDLKSIKEKFGTKTFFETGAGKGTGIEYASTVNFENIYSVEIIKSQSDYLADIFKADPRIKLINDTSERGLIDYFRKNPENTLFFLDAHFPGADLGLAKFGDEKDEDIRLPLVQELEIIRDLRAAKGFKDVILLDDLMLYDEDNIYPDSHLKLEHDIKPKGKYINAYMRILTTLIDTHDYQVFNKFSGYVVIYPRQKND